MSVMGAYAGDFKDFWPFPCRLEPAEGRVLWREHPVPKYGVVNGIWHFAILEAYRYQPFHASLLCPSDRDSLLARDEAATNLGKPAEAVGGTLVRRVSMAMYLDPTSLDPDHPREGPATWRPMRHGDLLFPSRKAALIETAPFHDPRYHGGPNLPPMPIPLTVASADGAAALRSTGSCNRPVLPWPASRSETRELEYDSQTMQYTAWGVRGQDW